MSRVGSKRARLGRNPDGVDRRGTGRRLTSTALALCVAVLAVALGAAVVALPQQANATDVKHEAETMTLLGSAVMVHSDVSASGGKDVAYFTVGSASTSFSGDLTSMNLRAREDRCGDDAKLRVFVDGTAKGTVDLTSSTFENYPLSIPPVGGGAHKLRVKYVNDATVNGCDRNAYLDYVTLAISNAVPPPPNTTPPSASDNPFAGEKFYVNPDSNARRTADQWYANGRTADAQQMEKIAGAGDIFYFSEWTLKAPGGTSAHVDWQTDRIEAAGALPVYGVYALPNLACDGFQQGFKTGADYKSWIDDIVTGLQGRKAVVVVEPDGIAPGAGCLTDAQLGERFDLIHYAVNKIEAEGSAAYIDASNCFAPDSFIADRLIKAGISDATGFARNVSNFCWTQDEITDGKAVSAMVGGKPFIIDTSRNGLGPYLGANNWCNPPGRALGPKPTANTGDPLVHAYYWLKRPGESDGLCNGYPGAGTWLPEYALGLAQRAAY